MQSKQKRVQETRVFPLLWANSTEAEKKLMRREIVLSTGCCPTTLWSWTIGKVHPRQVETMYHIRDAVEEVLGIKPTVLELFNYDVPWTMSSQDGSTE